MNPMVPIKVKECFSSRSNPTKTRSRAPFPKKGWKLMDPSSHTKSRNQNYVTSRTAPMYTQVLFSNPRKKYSSYWSYLLSGIRDLS